MGHHIKVHEPTTSPYHDPDESIPNPPILLVYRSFNIAHPSVPRSSSSVVLFVQVFPSDTCVDFLSLPCMLDAPSATYV
jgi:hypothetical protein